jgi:ERF superfamily protein
MNETSMPHDLGDEELPYDPPEDGAEPVPAMLVSSKHRRSARIGRIAAAMAKAQGVMKGALKDSANPFFKSKYADLASVWADCRQPLSDNQIAVFQMPAATGNKVTITTLLAHPSDEWVENELTMESKDASPQGVGSAITYARRYALAAMVGAYQIDDDGEQAQGRDKQPDDTAAKLLASNFKAALKAGIDGRINDVHLKHNADQELYLAAWQLLTAAERREIKAAIERVRNPNTNREPAEA